MRTLHVNTARTFAILGADQCWRLVGAHGVGRRLSVWEDEGGPVRDPEPETTRPVKWTAATVAPSTHELEPTHPPAGSIVVGIDGSASSDEALQWAVGHTALGSPPITLVHALDLLGPGQAALAGPSLIGPPELMDAATQAGRGILEAAAQRVRRLAPRLELYEVLSQADPRKALLAEASSEGMIVVGSRGRGPLASLVLGSVSLAVARHADCPVVVIRPASPDVARKGVLVGVDGSSGDRSVVALGFELASRHAWPLTVVHCFLDATHVSYQDRHVADDEAGLDDKRRLLREVVAPMTEKFPGVRTELQLVRGSADHEMVEQSRSMDVLVLGHRRSVFTALGFSSTAAAVVERAHCTVAVVPLAAS